MKTLYNTEIEELVCSQCFDESDEGICEAFGLNPDIPIHCAECKTLLPLELTDEGKYFVKQKVISYLRDENDQKDTITEWCKYYGDKYDLSVWNLYAFREFSRYFLTEREAIKAACNLDEPEITTMEIAAIRRRGRTIRDEYFIYLDEIKLIDLSFLLQAEEN